MHGTWVMMGLSIAQDGRKERRRRAAAAAAANGAWDKSGSRQTVWVKLDHQSSAAGNS
jgi:hypothetical protein